MLEGILGNWELRAVGQGRGFLGHDDMGLGGLHGTNKPSGTQHGTS